MVRAFGENDSVGGAFRGAVGLAKAIGSLVKAAAGSLSSLQGGKDRLETECVTTRLRWHERQIEFGMDPSCYFCRFSQTTLSGSYSVVRFYRQTIVTMNLHKSCFLGESPRGTTPYTRRRMC